MSKTLSVSIEKGGHGGTYRSNPLGCEVVAATVLHLIENKFSEKVARKGQIIEASLRGLAEKYSGLIKEVRGRGFLRGIQLYQQSQVTHLTVFTMQKGLLVVPTRNSVV